MDYLPRGAAWELFHSQAPELMLSGPAGTGKSIANLFKLHLCAERVPGFRGLLLRKTRESLTESGLVTFETKVVPEGHPVLRRGGQRRLRQAYHYPNGSEIVVGGLDKPGKIMSTDYDVVCVQEAIEITEDAWEACTTRLRNGKLPYQQMIGDTNPDRPTHWLKRRCEAGRCRMLESRHQDNPALWDAAAGRWTPFGEQYVEKLDRLTGPRLLRLRHGRWVQAEGLVYDGWDAAVHLIDRFPIPRDWPRLWVVDFGFTQPFVWQAWAVDPDGRLFRYREIYRTKTLVEDHARRILELAGWRREGGGLKPARAGHEPLPRAVVCDHDAEGRATLEKYLGLKTTPARKEKQPGYQAVAARLRPAGDGRPRLYLLRDSLDGRDEELQEARVPCATEEEIDGYVWDRRKKGEETREEAVDKDDHGMDALRYAVMHLDGTPKAGRPAAGGDRGPAAQFQPRGTPRVNRGQGWTPQ